ncbi:uncharacterized protein VTP21DRAFT_9914 [Calcarisporiella thermophila]|uniref:uncharacterized protein n=1 Tax=Calcarisporiella thermophila TaxID=911321 RepID=UPI003742E0EB
MENNASFPNDLPLARSQVEETAESEDLLDPIWQAMREHEDLATLSPSNNDSDGRERSELSSASSTLSGRTQIGVSPLAVLPIPPSLPPSQWDEETVSFDLINLHSSSLSEDVAEQDLDQMDQSGESSNSYGTRLQSPPANTWSPLAPTRSARRNRSMLPPRHRAYRHKQSVLKAGHGQIPLSPYLNVSASSCFGASSYLLPGRVFTGTQHLTEHVRGSSAAHREDWEVRVTIYSVDFHKGRVEGLMEATNVPYISGPVITYWEGEIVDMKNYTLWTKKWHADAETDLLHWRKFEPFRGLGELTVRRIAYSSPRFLRHILQGYVLMRWKEQFFINAPSMSQLTIAGWYYLSMRRSDGTIEGIYHDHNSSPYQHLKLKPVVESCGVSFPHYKFA